MINLPPAIRIFISTEPADMRRSFDGLAGMVKYILLEDSFSGHLFVFRNKKADRVKILFWDRTGYVIWYKRLEKGRFRFPTQPLDGCHHLELEASELTLLLEGIDLTGSRRRHKRYFC